jgi:CHAT domain-containing protein
MSRRQTRGNPWPRAHRALAATALATVTLALAGGDSPLASTDRAPLAPLRGALADTLAEVRPFALRLSLAGPHRPCEPTEAGPSATACDASLPDHHRFQLARAAQPPTMHSRDPAAAHLLAVTALVTRITDVATLDRAVDDLQRAAAAAPCDPDFLSDLAVAHALRGTAAVDPRHLLRALAATDRALALAPDAPAPAFNRALLLEQLGLDDSARLAWQRYIARHDEPGFTDEARNAHRRLRRRLAAAAAPHDLLQLARDASHGADHLALALAADSSPTRDLQRARELAFEHLLGAWGDAHRAGDLPTAERLLATTRRLGTATHESNGDCTVSASVAHIDAAANDPTALGRLAQAHAAYAHGATLFQQLHSEEALSHFQRAHELTAPDHPVHLWSRMGLAGVRFYRHDLDAAAAAFEDLVDATAGGCLHALAGRAAWGLGLTRIRQGRYTAALLHYRAAERRFAHLAETENLGALQSLLGETHTYLGQPDQAWASWRRALLSLGRYRGSLRLHNLLWQMARTAADELGPAAALALQNEGVLNARRSPDPALLPEALLWRARFHAAAGDLDSALADLDEAAVHNDRRPPGPAPSQIATDLQLARGLTLARRTDPSSQQSALEALSTALDRYRDAGLVLPQPEALLARARLHHRHGLPHQADLDLDDALALYRTQRAEIPGLHRLRSFTETVQSTFETALDLRILQLAATPEDALRLAEEAREVGFPGSPTTAADPLPLAKLAAADPDATVLVFTTTARHLHVWRLRTGGVDLASRPVDRSVLERRIHAFVAAVRRGATLDDLAPQATALHRLLLPHPLADLPPATTLYLVPDRTLAALPFDLLRDPATGRLLLEDHPIALAPSLHALAASLAPDRRLPGAPLTATLIADPAHDRELFPALPRLPKSEDEARRIAALYTASDLLAGADATPEALLAALDRHPVLHYAGHAVFNPEQPTLSLLPLAPPTGAAADRTADSTLFAEDLADRRLHTLRLVVLSACTTLGPTDRRTLSISGLARPFLDAGATAVLGTLWPVTDADSAALLPDFHRRFLATGNAVHALWRAKLAVAHDPQSHPPARWAGYQIVGQAAVLHRSHLWHST